MPTGPRGPAPQRRFGGPLPVVYVDLVAWFYPQIGDGEIWLDTWQDSGTDNDHFKQIRHELLGPITADIHVPRMASEWAYQVARMTDWPILTTRLLPGYDEGGAG